jgi:hypothetical protein
MVKVSKNEPVPEVDGVQVVRALLVSFESR